MNTPTPKPATRCRCCKRPMRADWQLALPGQPGWWLVTCETEGCAMRDYTFSEPRYQDVQIENYLPCRAGE
jgi:hypothetical protein